MSIAYKYYNNEEDAAAIVNTAFLKIFDNLDKYNFSTPIEAWMRRITINHIIDEFRKNKKSIVFFEWNMYRFWSMGYKMILKTECQIVCYRVIDLSFQNHFVLCKKASLY